MLTASPSLREDGLWEREGLGPLSNSDWGVVYKLAFDPENTDK